MKTLYPPFARCQAQHLMVRIDRPQRQCALEHACALTFGLQHPQACGKDMVDFPSQCHRRTTLISRFSSTLLTVIKGRKVIDKHAIDHFL